MERFIKPIIALFALCALTSCKSCESNTKMLQNVSGSPGEIIVVIDGNEWESQIGEILQDNLEGEYQVLPQKEPKFNLFNINPDNFSSLFWIHRNILIINISPENRENRMIATKDVWASPQTVVKINATDHDSAVKTVEENIEKIESIFEQAERDRIIANNIRYQEANVRQVVADMTGGSPYFPMGFTIKKSDDKFIWISYETTYINQGILIYRYPMTENTRLDLNSIIRKRNEVLKENVPGMFEGTYMTTTTLSQPELKWVRYKGNDFAEVRGLWEVYNDYMGGPFVSHSFYDRDGKNILVIEGFVYAPKYDKRNYLRQVESILYSFEWEK